MKTLKTFYYKIALAAFRYRHIRLLMPDKMALQLQWMKNFGTELDLRHPKTFNEKLQWLKLYDRNPLYTTLVDKYRVKQWVADKIGEEYVIPTLAVYQSVDEIDLDKLPNQFVLKCNHDSGSVVICRDKATFDLEAAKAKLQKGLRRNFYLQSREWPYKNVKRCILAEKYLKSIDNSGIPDYKFFTFDGVAKALFIATGRQNQNEETRFDFFDMTFKHLEVTNGHPNAAVLPSQPTCFHEMQSLVEKLSQGIPHVRVDFYEVDGKAYFGEMTFAHWGGFVPFNPNDFDKTMGEWIKLPGGKNLRGGGD